MPVYEQSYRPWEGAARPSGAASLAIAQVMIRRVLRIRFVNVFVISVPILALGISTLFFYFGYQDFWQMLQRRMPELRDLNMLHWMNLAFFGRVLPVAALVAAVVGAPLVAEDRKSRALPLYFSRPIRHRDYVLGKLLAVAAYMALLLLVPPVLMYVIDGLLSPRPDTWSAQLPSLVGSLAAPLAIIAVLSAMILAASSFTTRTNYAALVFLGIVFGSLPISHMLHDWVFQDPAWLVLAPQEAARRLAWELLPANEKLPAINMLTLSKAPLGSAITSLAVWGGAATALLLARIRRVEVVS